MWCSIWRPMHSCIIWWCNIVGCLVYVGKGTYEPAWTAQVLAGRDRAKAAPTFDGAGLYLAHVSYDAMWGLPQPARRAWFDGN